jgi:hypothetical protein
MMPFVAQDDVLHGIIVRRPGRCRRRWRRHDPRAFCQCANCSKIKSRPERVPLVTEAIGRVFPTPILGGLISDKDSPLLDDRHLAPSRTKSPRVRAPAAQKNTMTRLPVIEPRSAYIWSGFLQSVAGFGIGTYTFRFLYWVIVITVFGPSI